jgi:LmbE family N-acetylglucosaminyl deacetylase
MTANDPDSRTVGLIVAHPDDETLWAGGTVLLHPNWRCSIFTLCRGDDPDRAPKFRKALQRLGASGRMANLDDGPEQAQVRAAISDLLADTAFDLLLTHGPRGEYTRHRRHIETSNAVIALWREQRIQAASLWLFAYDDGNDSHLPRAAEDASVRLALPSRVWENKYGIIRDIYGFAPNSWEARTTPPVEAFWSFASPLEVTAWLATEVRISGEHDNCRCRG